MVPVRVLGLAMAGTQPVVLLTPLEDDAGGTRLVVPIWIGPQEAVSIRIAVEGEQAPRPLSHDLMQRLLAVLGADVDRVDVTRIVDGTFFAELHLSSTRGSVAIDCRPSDGIALACRVGAPLFVTEEVLAEAGVSEEPTAAAQDDEADLQEFRHFLDDVEPEDFGG